MRRFLEMADYESERIRRLREENEIGLIWGAQKQLLQPETDGADSEALLFLEKTADREYGK